jgi:hypothetical protein
MNLSNISKRLDRLSSAVSAHENEYIEFYDNTVESIAYIDSTLYGLDPAYDGIDAHYDSEQQTADFDARVLAHKISEMTQHYDNRLDKQSGQITSIISAIAANSPDVQNLQYDPAINGVLVSTMEYRPPNSIERDAGGPPYYAVVSSHHIHGDSFPAAEAANILAFTVHNDVNSRSTNWPIWSGPLGKETMEYSMLIKTPDNYTFVGKVQKTLHLQLTLGTYTPSGNPSKPNPVYQSSRVVDVVPMVTPITVEDTIAGGGTVTLGFVLKFTVTADPTDACTVTNSLNEVANVQAHNGLLIRPVTVTSVGTIDYQAVTDIAGLAPIGLLYNIEVGSIEQKLAEVTAKVQQLIENIKTRPNTSWDKIIDFVGSFAMNASFIFTEFQPELLAISGIAGLLANAGQLTRGDHVDLLTFALSNANNLALTIGGLRNRRRRLKQSTIENSHVVGAIHEAASLNSLRQVSERIGLKTKYPRAFGNVMEAAGPTTIYHYMPISMRNTPGVPESVKSVLNVGGKATLAVSSDGSILDRRVQLLHSNVERVMHFDLPERPNLYEGFDEPILDEGAILPAKLVRVREVVGWGEGGNISITKPTKGFLKDLDLATEAKFGRHVTVDEWDDVAREWTPSIYRTREYMQSKYETPPDPLYPEMQQLITFEEANEAQYDAEQRLKFMYDPNTPSRRFAVNIGRS